MEGCYNGNTSYSIFNDIESGITISTATPNNMIGGKKRTKRKTTKVVKGAKLQSRPSASYYYNTLNKPLGYKISYRPRKGGKYILHSLELRKNNTPYWKALEKLPKLSKKRSRKRTSKRSKKTYRGG
jgi:hypothetical protein